ncbi:MAG: hypothetical protein VB934_03015, partial [Polyangiaceae bacterium]
YSSYDISSHSDDTFILVWSDGNDIYGQTYSSGGDLDGAEIVISDAAEAATDLAIDTYTSGRFIVAWDAGSEIRARAFKKDGAPNGPIEVVASTTVGAVGHPAVGAYDVAGSFVVVWELAGHIKAQLFTKNAEPIDDEKTVDLQGSNSLPTVAVLTSEEGIIAWLRSDGHIYARKYGPNGEALTYSPEIIHNEVAELDQQLPAATDLGDLGYVMAWETGVLPADKQIHARLFSPTGLALGSEFPLNSTADGWQTSPAIDSSNAGDFVAIWESYGQDGDVEGIFARRFAPDGTPMSIELPVNTSTDYEQFEPDIAVDRTITGDGGFAAVWTHFPNVVGQGYDVMVRCYDASNNTLGQPEQAVNTYIDNDQSSPAVVALASGPSRYIVTWASKDEDTDNWGIFARRVSNTCVVQGDAFPVNSTTANVQSQPSITSASDGSYLISWRSLNQDGSSYGIYAQCFDSSGSTVDGEFKINVNITGEQSTPSVAFLTDDSLVAGWTSLGEDEEVSAVKFGLFNPDLSLNGLTWVGNIYYKDAQNSANVLALPGDRFLTYWRSEGQDGDGGTIVGRLLP